MNRKAKEQERMARRDVERFRRVLKKGGVKVSDLLMLQRAHDRLLEIKTAETKELLDQPVTEALKNGVTPQGMVELSLFVPRLVYHGTSEAAAVNILREGITPRGDRTPNHSEAPSHPECVYLTDSYALSYVVDSLAADVHRRGAVLEIELEPLMPNLLPDEDAVGASGPGLDPRGVIEKMAEGSGFTVNVLLRSLHEHGTVAHRGTVPVNAIRRVAHIPYTSLLGLVMTRWKTKLNWGAIRIQQQTILAWVFDGGDQPFPVPAEELVMDSGLCEQMAGRNTQQAESLMAAGVRADTLWRARLMVEPGMLNRDGIEVVEVAVNEEVPGDPSIVLGLRTLEAEGRECGLHAGE